MRHPQWYGRRAAMSQDNSKQSFSVSVVIPAYNAEGCIRRAIDSVLAQTFDDYEIIVVNDGSTDKTGELVKEYGSKVNYIYQDNAGESVARNTAIAASKGEWIACLDADDEWLPDKLALQMGVLKGNPDLRWCSANYYQVNGPRKAARGKTKVIKKALGDQNYFENYFTAAVKSLCVICVPTMVVRRDVFDEVGMFELGRASGPDLDMWWRIAYRYPQIGYIAEPLAVIYLDVENVVFTERRLSTRTGADARELIARHLRLANEEGSLSEFEPYAQKLMRKSLITNIYHGFKKDARLTVKQFSSLFPWYWRIGIYLLTIFPKLTSTLAHIVAYLRYRLGLEREVTRRWTYPKRANQSDSSAF